MDPDGPNLRRLYLPGLEALKLKLAAFEALMSRHLPLLHRHLVAAAVPSVLYASQWVMTSFACPFPHPFAARLIDVLLQVSSRRRAAAAGARVPAAAAALRRLPPLLLAPPGSLPSNPSGPPHPPPQPPTPAPRRTTATRC
jgi:hypothetical protein